MARLRTVLGLPLALLAVTIAPAVAFATVPPQRGEFYTPAPHPFQVGKAPAEIFSGSFDPMGRGFERNLLIGYAGGSHANLFYADRYRPGLHKFGSFEAPVGPSVFAGHPNELAILSPGSHQARLYETDYFKGGWKPASVGPTGPDPVAAVVDNYFTSGPSLNHFDLAVADHLTGQLQLFENDGEHLRPAVAIPLGPEPTAVATHECCVIEIFATTGGNNRLVLLTGYDEGEFKERRSFPVGNRPSSLALGDFVEGDHHDEEVAVANRGSDDVTILDGVGRTYDYRAIGTYPVGHEPVAVAALQIDHREGPDLAVLNAGSDNVSILLGDGRGNFRSGGTYRVGKHPVAMAAFAFNRAFGPDLAVVNRGSGDLTVLLRHVDGHCRGREAQREVGTDGPDRLSGLGKGPNQTRGLGGADTILGGFGGDCLSGEGGADEIHGGTQGDLIEGGAGDDKLLGGGLRGRGRSGNDTLVGGPGEDLLTAGDGADRILARDGGRDRIDCGAGQDVAYVDGVDIVSGCEHALVR
jgi:Ca2+-binding RTX toxin-like protein